MKKLLVLLFSLLISFNSYGEWEKVFSNSHGDTFYIDFDKIKKHDGYVYWWHLKDYLVPDGRGLSDMYYNQGDCENNRIKILTNFFFKLPMGEGLISNPSNTAYKGWTNPKTGGEMESWLILVCDYVD